MRASNLWSNSYDLAFIFYSAGAFDDEDVIHVDGDVNPVRDLETIGEELRLKDEDQLLKDIEKLERVVGRGTDIKLKPEYVSCNVPVFY